MKDLKYYNSESSIYSQKRYPLIATDYTHYLFAKRIKVVLDFLKKIPLKRTLIEIGCADGIVLEKITSIFPETKLTGVDVALKMVEIAKTKKIKADFYRRGEEPLKKYDIVLEIGVLNFIADFKKEIFDIADKMIFENGFYICSFAGKNSLKNLLKSINSEYAHLLRYVDYEKKLRERFEIIESVPYGLFIPFLWKIPAVARIIQPFFEFIFKKIIPDLFHEKVYLLKKK